MMIATEAARERFAVRNGWKVSNRIFSLAQLSNGKRHDGGRTYSHPLHCDHPDYFRKDGYPVAIMAHNYECTYPQRLREAMSARSDLVLHETHQSKAASWYFPLMTVPMCITRPGTEVVWPTIDEMVATISAYFDERRAHFERIAQHEAKRKLRAA